jgi:DnaJ like chaperone protein
VKSILGKFVGGTLGLAAGGPLGAVVGFLIGHVHDLHRQNGGDNPWPGMTDYFNDSTGNVQQATFTMGVIVLGAKMAKADGRVTRAEIEAFKRVFQVAPGQEADVGRLFDRARESAQGFEPYAFQMAQVFARPVLEEILGGLFIIAAADNAGLSPAEIKFLRRVAGIFNFDQRDLARIAARAGVHMPSANGTSHSAVEESFAILGVVEKSTNEEIKIAYRTLIREHHPDKLVAQGMPPEFVANANEKMKRINVAYDTVCKMRGIR